MKYEKSENTEGVRGLNELVWLVHRVQNVPFEVSGGESGKTLLPVDGHFTAETHDFEYGDELFR